MIRNLFLALLFIAIFSAPLLSQNAEVNIIPKPFFVKHGTGSFKIDKKTRIIATSAGDRRLSKILNAYLSSVHGFELSITKNKDTRSAIQIVANGSDAARDSDRTLVRINEQRLSISGGSEPSAFYALQSVLQLIPTSRAKVITIPALEIDDLPSFQYRGMHLDVARHFMPVEFVKKYIDLMSQYKFNYFHWHLTDDQGWRIEIKKYPKLTEIGSKRSESHQGSYSTIFKGDGIPIEGFYTQEQIREVVAYAKARYITVIPEIELPGHASAALAAYPQFGCKADYKYEVKKTWGIFKEVFCPTDETFKFLEDVLDETIKLFPDSPYIHIGGDEVLKDHWKESTFVQELKKRENLKDEHEVQSYFVQRIEKFVNKKGKKIIGWDEILEGGLAPNATVMSWRGMKGGIEAAKSKHDVIMTPTDYVYFDYGQGDPAYEPLNIGSYVPLEKVYSFEPVPKELDETQAKYIIGGQANVWTEYMKTPQQVEYMAFPRMLALSEVLWSKPEERNYSDFLRRLNAHLPRLDQQNVNYRIPEPHGLANAVIPENAALSIEGIRSEIPGAKIHYTVDGSAPTERSPLIPLRFVANPNEGEILTLRTIVVLPNGRKSSIYAATFVRGAMRESETPQSMKPGVKYEFLVPDDNSERKTDSDIGETRSILLNQFAQKYDLKKPFVVSFEGYIKAEKDEMYEFQIDSTWDTTVVLGNKKIIINDAGTKDRKVKSAIVQLKAGWHKISLRYNHRGGDAHFRVRYGSKGQGLRQIGGGELVH